MWLCQIKINSIFHAKVFHFSSLQFYSFLLSPSIRRGSIQPPQEKRNRPGKNMEPYFHFPASLPQPSRPAKHMIFLQTRWDKMALVIFMQQALHKPVWDWIISCVLFSTVVWIKLFPFLCRSVYSFQPPFWMYFCNFNSLYNNIS